MNKKASKNNIKFNKVATVVAVVLIVVISCVKLYTMWNSKTKEEYYKEHVVAGKEYMEEGCYVEAIHKFREAEMIKGDENVQVAIAECYLGLGDYGTFLTNAQQIQGIYGTNEKLYEDIAHYYDYMNDSYNEINTLKQGVVEHPECETLKVKYDKVKGDYTQVGYNVDEVKSVGEQYMVVAACGKEKVINATLSNVGGIEYDRVYDIAENDCISSVWKDTNMLYSAMVDGKTSYFDSMGYKRKSPDKEYAFLGVPRDGFALVQSNEGWGYIDTDFEEVGQWFDDATAFGGGMAAVKKNGKWAFIDSNFNYITEFEYDEVVTDDFKCCSGAGIAFAKKNDSYVMVDIKGEMEMKEAYSQAEPFYSKTDYAAVKAEDGWRLIDINGETVEKVECEQLYSSSNGIAVYRNKDEWGYIGVNGGVYVETAFEGATKVNKYGYAAIRKDEQWMFIHFSRFQVEQGL